MQSVDVINMRAQDVAIPGLGTVSAGTRKTGYVKTVEFDADFDAYKERTAAVGILVRDPGSSYTPDAYQSVTTTATVADATRSLVATSGSSYALTLMDAADVPDGEIVYFFHLSGANTVTITRAGSDTIDAGTTLALNAANPVRRLQSDGVSAWTSV